MTDQMAYCVKCRSKNPIKDGVAVVMKNGRPAIKGKCSKCETGIYKIVAGELVQK